MKHEETLKEFLLSIKEQPDNRPGKKIARAPGKVSQAQKLRERAFFNRVYKRLIPYYKSPFDSYMWLGGKIKRIKNRTSPDGTRH
jgi:hypothetical protein